MKDMRPQDAPQPGMREMGEVEGPTPVGEDLFDDEGEEQATPEEQIQYNQIITRAFQFLGSEESTDIVVKGLNNPRLRVSQAVGRFAARLAKMITGQIKAAGDQVSGAALLNAFVNEIIPKLFEVGEAAKLWDLSKQEEAQELDDAVIEATRNYGEMLKAEGELPTAEAQAFLQSQGVPLEDIPMAEAQPNPVAAGVSAANAEMAGGGGSLY